MSIQTAAVVTAEEFFYLGGTALLPPPMPLPPKPAVAEALIRVPRSARHHYDAGELRAAAAMLQKLRRHEDLVALVAEAVYPGDRMDQMLDAVVDRLLPILLD